jgi:hypothetical protein
VRFIAYGGSDIRWITLLIACVLTLLFPVHGEAAEDMWAGYPIPADTYRGGSLFRSGPVNVVWLHGSYRTMGQQYGHLLRRELRDEYEEAIEDGLMQRGFSYERLVQLGRSLWAVYPERYREILRGMAETSGLGLERQVVLNGVEWSPKVDGIVPHCSGFAVWGDYTGGGPLIFGRSNEDANFYRRVSKYLAVAVFHGDDNTSPVAIVNYAGVMYAPSGLNGDGLFLEINSGNHEAIHLDRLPIVVSLMSFLQDFPTVDRLNAALKSARMNLSSIINVADRTVAYSYECPTTDVRRRAPNRAGWLVATNHFTEPSWNIPPPDDETNGWTVTRYNNLLAQAEKYKGRFDVERMKSVLETTIEEGGPAHTTLTIYQIIAVPQDLTLWIRAPEQFGWQEVDLSRLLRKGR